MVELLPFLLLEIPNLFFHLAVLEVSIHYTVRYCLDFLCDCLLEGVVCKAAIFCVVMLDTSHVRPGVSLKHLLCFYCLL